VSSLDLDVTERTTAFTATVGSLHAVNTTTAAVTVTPPTATAGQMFAIVDSRANSETNAITVATTTPKLLGASDDFIINNSGASATFMYMNSTVGWLLLK
jgi:hypothetical protein